MLLPTTINLETGLTRSCFSFSRLFSVHFVIASVVYVRLRVMSRASFNRSKRIGRAWATPKMLARGSRRRETRVPARPLQRVERPQQVRGEARSKFCERKGSQTGLEGCTSAVPKTGSRRPRIRFWNQTKVDGSVTEASKKSVPRSGFHSVWVF